MSESEHHDPEAVGVEFHCQDVGVACKKVTRAANAELLVAAVAKHARDRHHVELNGTLIDYAVTKVRPAGD